MGLHGPFSPALTLPGFLLGGNDMRLIRKLLGLDDPLEDKYSLRVQPIVHGGFGVYANAVLLAIHMDRAAADAHCQQLRGQPVQG